MGGCIAEGVKAMSKELTKQVLKDMSIALCVPLDVLEQDFNNAFEACWSDLPDVAEDIRRALGIPCQEIDAKGERRDKNEKR